MQAFSPVCLCVARENGNAVSPNLDGKAAETVDDPPPNCWGFEAGGYIFRGKSFALTGKPLALLKCFVSAAKVSRKLTIGDIITVAWPEHPVDKGHARSEIAALRKTLVKKHCLRKSTNPIPADRRPAVWWLDMDAPPQLLYVGHATTTKRIDAMRITGDYRTLDYSGEVVRAVVPRPLPPTEPPLVLSDELRDLHGSALSAVERLAVAGVMAPNADWFLYDLAQNDQAHGRASHRRTARRGNTTGNRIH